MRYFFRRLPLPIPRLLLVESGSRPILEAGLPRFRAIFGDQIPMDLLTCLPGLPQALDPASTEVFPSPSAVPRATAGACCGRSAAAATPSSASSAPTSR